MCKTRTDATAPSSNQRRRPPTPTPTSAAASASLPSISANTATSSGYHPSSSTTTATSSSSASASSLASLRDAIPERRPVHIYPFSEISAATNNFLSPRLGGSSWRAVLRQKDAVIVQRRLRCPLPQPDLRRRLSLLAKSHHSSVAPLLGASVSGDYIYLVYDYAPGSRLSELLRNPHNPSFTVLSTWLTRIQVAADLSAALSYFHHYSGLPDFVHNHLTSSSVIISDPDLHAKICFFGAAQLAGEVPDGGDPSGGEEQSTRVEGKRGYMAPEILAGAVPTQKSDVYALGVVMLELITGEEPVRYRFNRERKEYERVSVVETAREMFEKMEEGRFRQWVDRRLRDSFPEAVAMALTRVAVECIRVEPDKRPDMRRVAGKVDKMLLESIAWAAQVRVPTEFTMSLAGR